MKDYIVTVMARDRVGIVRDVSSAITGIDGNITYLSQTVMRDYFTLIISAEMPDERTQLEIRQAIERSGDVGEFEVNVRPYVEPAIRATPPTERFTLSMQGNDQKGIIARATGYLATRNVNVDDFYCYVRNGVLLMLAQVSVPVELDIEELQRGLESVGEQFGLIARLQHENIFHATLSVRPVMNLQRQN
ncbi:MAG: glycine cleavage system transcriptional repressor [Armatimonadota bacterium]